MGGLARRVNPILSYRSEPDEPPAIPNPTTESHFRASFGADWLLQRNVSKIFPCGNYDARCYRCSCIDDQWFIGLDFLNGHELFRPDSFLEEVHAQADFFQNWWKRSRSPEHVPY